MAKQNMAKQHMVKQNMATKIISIKLKVSKSLFSNRYKLVSPSKFKFPA